MQSIVPGELATINERTLLPHRVGRPCEDLEKWPSSPIRLMTLH
jgi:hypothetical protein